MAWRADEDEGALILRIGRGEGGMERECKSGMVRSRLMDGIGVYATR